MGPEAGGEGVPLDEEEDESSSDEERVSPRRTRRECVGGPCNMAAAYKSKAAQSYLPVLHFSNFLFSSKLRSLSTFFLLWFDVRLAIQASTKLTTVRGAKTS